MARLSFLLACLLGLTTTVSAAALPSAHEDLPWNVNNKRSPLPSPFGKKGYGGKGKGGKHHGPGFVEDDTCALLQELPVKAPKENLWLDLTNDEVKGLLQWLHAPEQGLNLTEYAKAGAWDNYVTVTEAIMPNKTSVLSYLSGKGPKPDKYARVVISNGATEEAYLEDFEVRFLPGEFVRTDIDIFR